MASFRTVLSPVHRVSQEQVRLTASRPVALVKIPHLPGSVPPHDHDYFECTVVLEGGGWHCLADGDRILRRGDAFVLSPDEVHGYRIGPADRPGLWNLYYLAEWLLADLPLLWEEPGLVDIFLAKALFPAFRRASVPLFRLSEPELLKAVVALEGLSAELQRDRPSIVWLKGGLLQFFILLVRSLPSERLRSGFPHFFRPEVWALVRRVDEVLARREVFSLGQECRLLGLSRDRLGRLFREATGLGPMAYYQARRVQLACVRLLEPEVRLTSIAHDLGFSDSAHFSRVFRLHRGFPPREYHRRYRLHK